jgi:hypothetical protein
MTILASYLDGIEAALEKVASSLSDEQARKYLENKNRESRQDMFMGSAAGIGSGIGSWALEGLTDVDLPISGKAAILPAAALGYSASKLKNVFDSPKEMYIRDGELTGRSIGGLAGLGLGAGLGAGIGSMLDSTGIGLGLGGLFGQALGQEIGDYATEMNDQDKVQKLRERAKRNLA